MTAALSTDSVDAIARHCTHYIQRPAPTGQPQLVVVPVEAVVTAVRYHDRLLPCRKLFAEVLAACR